MLQTPEEPQLAIAFPKSETELRVVFSEPVEKVSAEDPSNYKTRNGLAIFSAHIDRDDPRRVSLITAPMNGEAMVIDVLDAPGVRTLSSQPFTHTQSPEFIQGIASIPEIQKPSANVAPFASRFIGKVASASCGKDGGVDSNALINAFGFAFIHMEAGGPFNSLKIVTQRHIPGIAEFTRTLSAGQTAHVLWAGGEIRNVNGETQLVDTGYMEGSIIPPNPLMSPPPFPIKVAEVAGEAARSQRAKGLQGVVVRFENVTIDRVSDRNETGMRTLLFHDDSGGQLQAVLLSNVTVALQPDQKLKALRGLLHQPKGAEYEVILELDQHFSMEDSELFGHVIQVEGYALPNFSGCHALVSLRDKPGTVIAVMTSEYRLQSLLETALRSGALIACWGAPLVNPPSPRGGVGTIDVYGIDGVIVYDRP